MGHYFQVESEDLSQDFISYMDEGLQQIEAKLGPGTWGPPEELRALLSGRLEGRLKETLSELPEEVAAQACSAAMEKVELHKAALESSVEAQKLDYDWARETWSLEKDAALAGDLKWHIFVATKP